MNAAPDAAPRLGLLLDVDGPIASPVSRSIAIPSITRDLVRLATAGVPIAFNTGRSDAFIRDEVVAPLIAAGLPDDVELFAVCEKGAVWFTITNAGIGELHIDHDLAVPASYGSAIRRLVADRFDGHMFYDETKRAMVSVEQHTHVENHDYRAVQRDFDREAFDEFTRQGLGVTDGERTAAASDGRVRFRVDPTIISTDLESVSLGKDLGASRVIEWVRRTGRPMPQAWRTVGDSRTDYAMAEWLHARGHDVAHVDVRPTDGVPETPYPVLTAGSLVHDEAGAAFLERWVDVVEGRADRDDSDMNGR